MSEEPKDSFPSLTQEPVQHIDCIPNADYPLRILRAHRQNCDCHYAVTDEYAQSKVLWGTMNDQQKLRAKLLDKAHEILFRHSSELFEVIQDAD